MLRDTGGSMSYMGLYLLRVPVPFEGTCSRQANKEGVVPTFLGGSHLDTPHVSSTRTTFLFFYTPRVSSTGKKQQQQKTTLSQV